MSNSISWWIIQQLRGVFSAVGPYRTEAAARNRYEKTKGGEVHLWKSWYGGEHDHEKVIDEYRAAQYQDNT